MDSPAWVEALNSFGVVGMSVLIVVALMRGWIVTGKAHDAEIARYEKGRDKDAETILILSKAVTEQKATESATTKIITSLRDIVANGGGSDVAP